MASWVGFGFPPLVLIVLLQLAKVMNCLGVCDLYQGSWVSDPSYPLYNATTCPFIAKEFNCQKNGRPDTISNIGGTPMAAIYQDYLYVIYIMERQGRILKLDSVGNSGNDWKGLDMLIFNTWHWWNYRNALQPWDYIQVGNQVMKDMDRMAAFERALNTRRGWVDTNTNPMKTMEHGASSSSKLQLVRNQQAEQNTAITKPRSRVIGDLWRKLSGDYRVISGCQKWWLTLGVVGGGGGWKPNKWQLKLMREKEQG
ncbi:hypothetical protein ACSBR1_012016 [Camellia fascicularis]